MSIGTLTLEEALAELNNPANAAKYSTIEGLESLVEQVSVQDTVAVPNARTYGYSGGLIDGMNTNQLAKSIAESEGANARIIDRTPAAKFLSSLDYQDAVKNAIKTADPNLALPENGTQLGKAVNDYMFDSTNGPWANRSAEFMETAKGPVTNIVPDAKTDRVWAETEFARQLANPDIPDINGIPKETLLDFKSALNEVGYSEAETMNITRQLISLKSRADLAEVSVAKNAAGDVIWTDAAAKLSGGSNTSIPAEAVTRSTVGEIMGSLSKAEAQGSYAELRTAITALENNSKYYSALETTGKVLGTVGSILIGVSAVFMAIDANAAYAAGDTAKGDKIIRDWTLGTIGAIVVGGLGFESAAAVFAGLALLGPLGIGAGVAAVIIVGIAGGYLGHKGGTWLGDKIDNLLSKARNLFLSSEAQASPLILDLDGDGVETTALASGIQFDHDTNGFAEKTAWVGTDDGLLVRDINGNGIIDNGTELFGNNTILKNGQRAANGFAALADLDENHDGKINANDTAYNQLRVWKDANGDGITDQGELITLADAGVQSITTTYTTSTTVDANGNEHKQTSSFTRTDGTTAAVDDVWFRMDAMYSTPNQLLAETDEIAALPELQGYGVVYSLHQAMLRDESGSIKSLVEQFAAADGYDDYYKTASTI